MPAYVIVDVTVNDPAAFEEYRLATPATVAAYDGRFLARGGAVEALEGQWLPKRLVMIEFPSIERAKQWLISPEYSAIKDIRHRAADAKMIIVEGYTHSPDSNSSGTPM